jgi:hypothetical protein
MIDSLGVALKENFAAITVSRGNKNSYLAMNQVVSENGVALNMVAYVKKCLEGKVSGLQCTYC